MCVCWCVCWCVWLCACVCVFVCVGPQIQQGILSDGGEGKEEQEPWDHIMLETFGRGSHKHTHARTSMHAHTCTHAHTHAHTHNRWPVFVLRFWGKEGKMTSSSSCEASETDGGENTGKNRTLLHKKKNHLSSGCVWAPLPYFVCVCVCMCDWVSLSVWACISSLAGLCVCKLSIYTQPHQGVRRSSELVKYLQSDCLQKTEH